MPQPLWLIPAATIGLAATVPISGTINSLVIVTGGPTNGGWQAGGVGLSSSQAGLLKVQRFLDAAGLIPMGAVIQGTLVAATPLSVSWADNLPFQSMQITVTNSSGSVAATLTNVTAVLQSV